MKLSLTILTIFLSLTALGTVWHVSPSMGRSAISNTIAKAAAHDTVVIEKGLYKEGNIIIGKPLYIKGKSGAILDGENKYEIISVKSNDVTIEGLQIQHAGYSSTNDYAGIKIYNARNVSIFSNTILETYFGIYGQFIKNCNISNNVIRSHAIDELISGNGIHCWKSDSVQIMHNTVSGHRDGIYFEFVTNSTIVSNNSNKNLRYGLHFMFSSTNIYVNNIFSDNGSGVAVMYSKQVKMFGNRFVKSNGSAAYGILLKDISDSEIGQNYFMQNTTGVYMEGTSRIHISHNQFRNNGWAFKISANCMDIDVAENNFTGNTFDVGTNGTLNLNRFKNNYWDKYEGYDLNRDGIGDIPYRPVSMYSMIVEKNPSSAILLRSFMVTLMDKIEKIIPSLTPIDMIDALPLMKPTIK